MSELQLYADALLDDNDVLEHHGRKGQKWGTQNGPPYPLSRKQLSSAEAKESTKVNPARAAASGAKHVAEKAGAAVANAVNKAKTTHEEHKAKKEAERAEKERQEAEAAEKAKVAEAEEKERQRVENLYKYSAAELLDHRLEYSPDEIASAVNRLKERHSLAEVTIQEAKDQNAILTEQYVKESKERQSEMDQLNLQYTKESKERQADQERWMADLAKMNRGKQALDMAVGYGKTAIEIFDVLAIMTGKPTLTGRAQAITDAWKEEQKYNNAENKRREKELDYYKKKLLATEDDAVRNRIIRDAASKLDSSQLQSLLTTQKAMDDLSSWNRENEFQKRVKASNYDHFISKYTDDYLQATSDDEKREVLSKVQNEYGSTGMAELSKRVSSYKELTGDAKKKANDEAVKKYAQALAYVDTPSERLKVYALGENLTAEQQKEATDLADIYRRQQGKATLSGQSAAANERLKGDKVGQSDLRKTLKELGYESDDIDKIAEAAFEKKGKKK